MLNKITATSPPTITTNILLLSVLPLTELNVLPRQQNDAFNEEATMTPTIETPRAGEIIDDLLAVPGVDGNLNGSNDLCTDAGILGQYDYTLYQDTRPCL
ncbi:hypothetical protein WAI453_000717 [Rhynchosporium graminicola]|uniref:Uncharacterized protein n=1 Tax=Rhynchosporium graminicola TaxID=2792576 RepID=A0A1E1LVE0_9HELO|nr:uncharacterized protein RCO7_15273 [Rhynchosporium commune]